MENNNRVLRLSRFHAKKLMRSLTPYKRRRVDFDALVSVGYIAGVPKKDEQSLWRWIRNAQIKHLKFIIEKKDAELEYSVHRQACPECGCKEFINGDLVGTGFHQCVECGQDWNPYINYSRPKRTYIPDETILDNIIDIQWGFEDAGLTDKETDVIHYRFWENLSFRDIAHIYKVTWQTIVECYYKPAIRKLGKYLKGK